MNYITLTPENLEKEHICCAISNNKDPQVLSKKAWLRDRLAKGLVFLKADLRGKYFIEYIPAEYAWVPIEADHYMHINCLWVSGSCKGHGYANELLDACIADAKAKEKSPHTENSGFALYYTCGCPFTAKYVPLIEKKACELNIPFKSIRINNRKEAQNAPAPWTNYALFYNGTYITNEILSEKKFMSVCMKLTGGEM